MFRKMQGLMKAKDDCGSVVNSQERQWATFFAQNCFIKLSPTPDDDNADSTGRGAFI